MWNHEGCVNLTQEVCGQVAGLLGSKQGRGFCSPEMYSEELHENLGTHSGISTPRGISVREPFCIEVWRGYIVPQVPPFMAFMECPQEGRKNYKRYS